MYRIVWAFAVGPGNVAAFERIYGAEGDWARLFRPADAEELIGEFEDEGES